MTPKPATAPQVPAVICGLFSGANVRLRASFSYPGFAWQAGDVVRVLEVDAHLSMFEAVVGGTRLMVSVSDVDILLGSPQAMCHAARWLAEKLGMDPGATAPKWYRQEECGIAIWILEAADGCAMFWTPVERCYLREYAYVQAGKATGIDDISDLTNDAEALAAACVAVGGAA